MAVPRSLGWVVLALSLCELTQAATTSDCVVQNYHAGKISIEMTPTEASKQYASEHVKWWRPYPHIHVIDVDPSGTPGTPPALRLNLDSDQKQIWLSKFPTSAIRRQKESNRLHVRRAAKSALALKIRIEEGEMDRNIVAEIVDEGIACLLEFDQITQDKMLTQPNSHNVPPGIIPDEKRIPFLSVIRPESTSSAERGGWED